MTAATDGQSGDPFGIATGGTPVLLAEENVRGSSRQGRAGPKDQDGGRLALPIGAHEDGAEGSAPSLYLVVLN